MELNSASSETKQKNRTSLIMAQSKKFSLQNHNLCMAIFEKVQTLKSCLPLSEQHSLYMNEEDLGTTCT
jgi:hypothetical protein